MLGQEINALVEYEVQLNPVGFRCNILTGLFLTSVSKNKHNFQLIETFKSKHESQK